MTRSCGTLGRSIRRRTFAGSPFGKGRYAISGLNAIAAEVHGAN